MIFDFCQNYKFYLIHKCKSFQEGSKEHLKNLKFAAETSANYLLLYFIPNNEGIFCTNNP